MAVEGISPFHLAVPSVVFGEHHPDLPAPLLMLCAVTPGLLMTTAGYRIEARHGLDALAEADLVIVPGWPDGLPPVPPPLLAALRAAAARGVRLVGLCLGAFVLAEAGLLDGRPATTHWAYAARFAERYPAVRLDADVLFVDDGAVVTSAGTAAGLDCCLHLVRSAHGAAVANRMARRLVVPPQRTGGQAQFIERPLPVPANGDRLDALLLWLRAHLHEPQTLDALAARALMSRRTFTRRFRQRTGQTVGEWLDAERLQVACHWLETSRLPVAAIAERAGFGSATALRERFGRVYGLAPAEWRRRFGHDAGGEPRSTAEGWPQAGSP